MKHDAVDKNDRLLQAALVASRSREFAIIGPRPAPRRALAGYAAIKNLVLAVLLAASAAGIVNVSSNTGMLNTAEQTTQATVIGKVRQPSGVVLGHGAQKDLWQSANEASKTSHQLVLEVDGQKTVIAVSPDVYDQYCKTTRPDISSVSQQQGFECTGTKQEHLDVAYTRSKITDQVAVTRVDGMKQAAPGFLERLTLQRSQRTPEVDRAIGATMQKVFK